MTTESLPPPMGTKDLHVELPSESCRFVGETLDSKAVEEKLSRLLKSSSLR